jgi:transposase
MKVWKFVDFSLEPLVIKAEGRDIHSFRIMPEESNENIEEIQKTKRTDGLWMIITNIPGKEEDIKGFTEGDLISAYRDKNQIEQAFKNVKSFIKIQPFNVWKPKHVRAHYTICVLSYLLDITSLIV